MDIFNKGILIIDDEEKIIKNYRKLLDIKGFKNIYTASSLSQSLNILAAHGGDIHLILLDIMLPDGNGLTIVEHLLNSHDQIIGIIIITGHHDLKLAVNFYEMGSDLVLTSKFLLKPINIKELIDQVQRTLHLIDEKRKKQNNLISEYNSKELDRLGTQLQRIEEKLINLENKFPSFLKELGGDVLRMVIIGFAVLAYLFFNFDSVIQRIIEEISK